MFIFRLSSKVYRTSKKYLTIFCQTPKKTSYREYPEDEIKNDNLSKRWEVNKKE